MSVAEPAARTTFRTETEHDTMTEADRARLAPKIADLKRKLGEASDIVEEVRADVHRVVEGTAADDLIFWPLVKPSVHQPITGYSAWLERVRTILGDV